MKKFLTMLLVGIMSSVLLTTPAGAYSSSEMPNALLLFVGTNSSYSWSPYPSYSNNDLDKILDATKEFVIINSNATYNYYQKNGTATQIVSNSSINAIQSSDVQYANKLADVKEDYFGLLSSVGSYSSVTLVNDLVIEKEKLLDFYGYSYWNLDYLSNEAKTVAQSYKKLNDIVTSYGGYFIYVGVPQQSTYFSEYYPKYMDSRQWHTTAIRTEFSAAMEEAGVPFLNMTELYKKEGNPDEYYFNTDHHYTYAGAYESYKAIVERINTETGWQIPKMEKKDLIWEQLLNPFLGSSNRKLYALHPTEDKIEIAYPKEEIPFSRTDNGVPTSAQIYSLPENDKTMVDYTVYMGGDIGETIIETSRPSLRKALIVGDSFTNPLETLLWMSFDETRSLDYRHYSEKNLLDYIKEYQPDVVITVRDESVYLSQEGNGAIS